MLISHPRLWLRPMHLGLALLALLIVDRVAALPARLAAAQSTLSAGPRPAVDPGGRREGEGQGGGPPCDLSYTGHCSLFSAMSQNRYS